MAQYIIGTEADLTALEAECWVTWMRGIVTELWEGEIKDVQTGVKHAVADLSDAELNDRDRFPLFGYSAGKLRTDGGYTKRWDTPQEVTKADSPHLGKFFMPLPVAINDRWQAVLDLWNAIKVSYPDVSEITAEPADLVEPSEEV